MLAWLSPAKRQGSFQWCQVCGGSTARGDDGACLCCSSSVSDVVEPVTPRDADQMLAPAPDRDSGDADGTEALSDAEILAGVERHYYRPCPGMPWHGDYVCGRPAESGDRWCAGCRAEWDALSLNGADRKRPSSRGEPMI